MLANVRDWADVHFFYDDQSTDDTFFTALRAGCYMASRHRDEPSFEMDEGFFRGTAWRVFEQECLPKEGDWVLVIDCDEMLVGDGRPIHEALGDVLCAANQGAVDLNIPEVFGFDSDGCPLVRVDRLWGTIHAPRLFTYRRGGMFTAGKVGVPAVPTYVMGTHWQQTDLISLMHFGYADQEDRQVKFKRYSGVPGHLNAHVASIVEEPALVRWEYPLVGRMHYRGDRNS
jgi:hypothetical protein